jgi:hypothetical protein
MLLHVSLVLPLFIKYFLNITSMVVITCKVTPCEGNTNKEECDEAWYTPPVDDSRSLVQPGCIEPNEQGECYIGMPGEKLPTPIEEAQNQNENQDNDNNDTDISEVEETEENWFN